MKMTGCFHVDTRIRFFKTSSSLRFLIYSEGDVEDGSGIREFSFKLFNCQRFPIPSFSCL
jgi:hypothetical protein